MAPSAGTQRLKDRELWKYFDHEKVTQATNGVPLSSYDPALKAFAQLGALRLSAKRCMISLFDKSNQYIIAEATKTLSLQEDSVHDEGDGVWLGVTILPKCSGLCKLVVDGDSVTDLSELGLGGAPYVIPDLKADERFMDAQFGPDSCAPSRFYAGVPITTKEGAAIGSYCILDDQPHDDLSPVLLQFMEHMASTVMSHLELTRARDDERRGAGMVNGLSQFIAGGAHHKTQPADRKNAHVSSAVPMQRTRTKRENSMDSSSRTESVQTIGRKDDREDEDGPSNVQDICTRAADLIRYSLDVEGVIFFDASVASIDHIFDGSDASDTAESNHYMSSGDESKHSSPELAKIDAAPNLIQSEAANGILGSSYKSHQGPNHSSWAKEHLPKLEKYMLELLKRHTKGKIFNFDEDGAMFSGDSSSDSANTKEGLAVPKTRGRKSNRRVSEKTVSDTIMKTFPEARCVAMTPLWDSHRERWFAGVLVWTTNPHRNFDVETDISYLTAFGNSIMAEIASVDANTANKAKTALLGSISHELRSPLHGIMGGVEILEESKLDAFQSDVLHTVETCGKTLLDTVDHLLDFSKINNSMIKGDRLSGKSKSGSGRQKQIAESVHARAPIDLDILVEEVIEVVFAGHGKRLLVPSDNSPDLVTKVASNLNSPNRSSHAQPGPYWKLQGSGIMVTFDIEAKTNWSFRVQPGAVRRIIMNLFSNALKYTKHGFIDMSLRVEPQILSGDELQSKVIFTINDSGRGMSKKYMQDRLYKPFAQENVLDPGTGLGLSIVSQIVMSLGGKINLTSTLGIGTKICVSIPMTHGPIQDLPCKDNLRDYRFIREKTKGLYAQIMTPGNTDSDTGSQTDVSSPILLESITRVLEDWFEMVPYSKQLGEKPSIYVVIESASNLGSLSSGSFLRDIPARASHKTNSACPLVVVLCRSSETAYHLASINRKSTAAPSHIVEFITQPCAPQKLARALSLCFERSVELAAQNIDSDERPVSIVSRTSDEPHAPLESGPSDEDFMMSRRESLLSPEPFGSRSHSGHDPLSEIPIVRVNDKENVGSPKDERLIISQTSFLLVDDNPINLKILIAYMKKNNYSYTTAMDGQQALDAYRISPMKYRIILMDISMPVMDGLTSTRAIRFFEREHKIKPANIIILTGLIEKKVQREAVASGADLFLTKPVRLKALGEILKPLEQPFS